MKNAEKQLYNIQSLILEDAACRKEKIIAVDAETFKNVKGKKVQIRISSEMLESMKKDVEEYEKKQNISLEELKDVAKECDYSITNEEINLTFERENEPFDKVIKVLKSPNQGLYNRLTDEVLDNKDEKMLKAVERFCDEVNDKSC